MFWIVYNVLFGVGYALMTPRFLVRMWRRGGYGRGFWQRFGFYDRGTHKKLLASSGRIWIHAVSVGEILVALRFVDELRKGRGCPGFVVSTTTSTGYALARKLMHPDDVLVYFPLDFPVVLRRVLPVLNPRALVLTECEIWPNLIRLLKQRKVPIVLINGRISRSSYRGYEKIRLFLTPILRWVDLFLVQTDADRERLISLGAEPGKVVVTGSAKYDEVRADVDGEQMARSLIEAAGIGSNDPILLGGSTWPGEETVLMETQRRLRARWPNLRLILVPRHVERADKIAREIRARGLNCVKRSALPSGRMTAAPDVLLVDTTGELKNLYTVATVIFVGKSLCHHGGQNIIEPAIAGKPIVVGPYMENFEEIIYDFRRTGAVRQVHNREEFYDVVESLLADPAERDLLGRRARNLVEEKRGVVRRSVDLMAPILGFSDAARATSDAAQRE